MSQSSPKRSRWKAIAITIVVVLSVQAIGAVAVIYSGFYNIAANEPHAMIVRQALKQTARESVIARAPDIALPDPTPDMIRQGVVLYQKHCVVCHGAPGIAPEQMGRGINPTPPQLVIAATHWSDGQLYWITMHGLKMSGMPAFGVSLSEKDAWSIVAVLREIGWLTPTEYRQRLEALDLISPNSSSDDEIATDGSNENPIQWVKQDDEGLARMTAEADIERGRKLLDRYGCGSCHVIPSVGRGLVGASLVDFAERQYIAGSLVNSPDKLVDWIIDPKRIEPGTAMPDLHVAPEEALDMAAYLYTLGETQRFDRLKNYLRN
tara:strand:- start:6999 stop:7961 length:963 start_codon:yes stop_codon:yes gene_type:complete